MPEILKLAIIPAYSVDGNVPTPGAAQGVFLFARADGLYIKLQNGAVVGPFGAGVTNGNSHDHSGGDGAQVDHGGLGGLADDDHTQYHTDARGDARYALTAKGVTNGDSHDHSGGDGAQIDHGALGGLSDNDHTIYNYYPCTGRLTLESGVPVSTTDQSAKATLYYTPFVGNKIALYNGATWDILTFAEISISLAGKTASKPHDVFVYNNSGTAALELLEWTSVSARATTLTRQDGVLCKTGALTRRYIGTIHINASGGQTDDSLTKRLVWNYYNRQLSRLFASGATSHTYNGVARLWNNSETGNRIEFVVGVSENPISYYYRGAQFGGADGYYAVIAYYLDGSEINTIYRIGNFNAFQIVGGVSFVEDVAAGYHYANIYGLGNHNSSTLANFFMSAALWR